MDKNQSLKNNAESINLDSKVNEKKNNSSNDISNSGIHEHIPSDSAVSANDDSNSSAPNSNNFGLDLAVLNEISKIAQMGMSSISCLTNKISDHEMKKTLVAMYSQYSNILLQVNQHFEKYGEVPDDISLSSKVMSCCAIKKNLAVDKSNSHIAEMMIQGTLMGVIQCQKILNGNIDIDKSTLNLLKTFNKFQRENIDKLNAYL